MIPTLQALATLLARDPLTVDEVIGQLGAAANDYGSNVMLTPRNPLFGEINVVRALDAKTRKPANIPAYVELTLVAPAPLATLAQAFGSYRTIPAEDKVPPQVIFYLEQPGQPYAVALIAEVKRDAAVRLTLRRDIRLK